MKIVCWGIEEIDRILEFEKEYSPPEPYYKKYTRDYLEEMFADLIDSRAFGGYEGKELVAYGLYRKSGEKDYVIGAIIVANRHRRAGLGKTLLTYMVEDILKNQANAEIKLKVYPGNVGALCLYVKNGFEVTDFKKDCFGPGEDRLILKYSINPTK